jgi:Tfp pilus assembly protein PilF
MYMSKRFNRVITSATVLLVVMGGLAGCDHVFGVGEQELIQRAKNFKDKGDTKAAIIELKSALQKNPNSAEARWLLGQVYVLAGQGSNAEKELAQAAKLGIKEESIAASMGQALLLQQDYERVLKEVKLNPKASPKDAAWNKGVICINKHASLTLVMSRFIGGWLAATWWKKTLYEPKANLNKR